MRTDTNPIGEDIPLAINMHKKGRLEKVIRD